MSYFLWGCRGILILITLRSERVNSLRSQIVFMASTSAFFLLLTILSQQIVSQSYEKITFIATSSFQNPSNSSLMCLQNRAFDSKYQHYSCSTKRTLPDWLMHVYWLKIALSFCDVIGQEMERQLVNSFCPNYNVQSQLRCSCVECTYCNIMIVWLWIIA